MKEKCHEKNICRIVKWCIGLNSNSERKRTKTQKESEVQPVVFMTAAFTDSKTIPFNKKKKSPTSTMKKATSNRASNKQRLSIAWSV